MRMPSETVPEVAPSLSPTGEKQPWLIGLSAGYGVIRGDDIFQLNQFDLSVGGYLAQTERFQLGLEILPSMTLWLAQTDEGFDNDVFGDFYTVKIRLTGALIL
jgi:hypothetical protein